MSIYIIDSNKSTADSYIIRQDINKVKEKNIKTDMPRHIRLYISGS